MAVSSGISRRTVLRTAGAAAAAACFSGNAFAQAKIAPPAIVKAGHLVMSINPTLPPLQYTTDKGEVVGMRAELGNELARRLGLTPEYVRIDGVTTMIPGLAAKRWDMINTGTFWSEERSKIMYMIPTEGTALSILAAAGNPLGIKTVEDLAGRRISSEHGSTQEARTKDISASLVAKGLKPIEIRSFNNFAEAFQALRAGQVDGCTVGDSTALFMAQRGDFSRVISGLFSQASCLCFANKQLAETVVGLLNDMKKDGYYDMLTDKYGVVKMEKLEIRGPGPA